MDDDMKKICPCCSQLYSVQFTSSKVKGNFPLFLPCGHSMCENCIVNIIKCLEPIECKVCHRDADVKITDPLLFTQNKLKLHQMFPVNFYMIGELTVNLMKASDAGQKKIEENFIDLKALIEDNVAQGNCLECHIKTSKMCKECSTCFCDNCFNKTHKNFVLFKSHILQAIETTIQPNNCKLHIEKSLDYYCKDCDKAICMDCMMVGGEKSCKNHDVVSLQEINETFLEKINETSPQVDETFRRLTKTAVDIGYLLQNYENDTGSAKELTHIIADVDQHFSKLCSIVQKHKEEIINIILYLKLSEKESLQKAKSSVANSIKKAKNVLNKIKVASETAKIKQINLPVLYEEAQQVANTPWYLHKNEPNKESLKVTVNEDLCSLISDYVHLEGNVKSVYKLSATSELDEDVAIPPAPTAPVFPPELPKDARLSNKPKVEKEDHKGPALYKRAPKYRSKSGSVSSLNSNSSDGSSAKSYITQNNNYQQQIVVQPVSPFPDSQHPPPLREGTQELIYISHIVDPHNFFVQRACFQGLVKDMLREFRNAVSFAKPSVNHITPGKTYLAFNKADNMWQRCRVISIDMKDNVNPIVQVFCYDFGSIEFVSVDRLRLLPPSKIQCPFPLATNCSLANCEPITGAWTSEDSFLIQNIIDNKQAVIHIRRLIQTSKVDFKLECDITTFENGISLVHALVFHERAKMPYPKLSYPAIIGVKEKPKLYMSHNEFQCESTELVCITHVVSPDKFFVRKYHLQGVYEKLSEDLEQEYSLASTYGTVYLPEIGMVCAVNVEKYRSDASESPWARGLVTELPGRGRVRVLLPDSGVALLVHWAALRYIHSKFTTLRALATECHLAGITPYNKKWSTASVALLQKYEGNVLELQVEDNRSRGNRSRGSIGVTLYDKQDDENIVCINNEMTKHKFAVSFGVNMFNNNPLEEQVITNKSPPRKPSNPPKPKPDKVTILKKQMQKKVNEDDLQAKDKGPLRLEAKILHYQSPSLIYVSLVHQQKSFNELFEKMQKYYSKNNKNKVNEDWMVGDRCCTLCQQSKTWRRAVILELEAENVKVFYSDFAFIETIPKSSLKELTSEFGSFGDAAIKCHLCGIVPAVGEEWPSLTKEYLKELIDAYKRIFITKSGNFKDKSMPIEMWVYHIVTGGALEPNKAEWRCLNKKIIEQGLGIPDKSEVVAAEDNAEDGGNTLSFLNITGSVNEWLQLEPMPMVPLKTAKSDLESNTNSPSFPEREDNNARTANPESSNVMYITDWLPPESLPCKEFTGVPTYIDNDGVIYLHDVSQQGTLDLIRKALDIRFKDPDPKAKFTKWNVGEPCVALYYLDNRYYRGRVIEVNQDLSSCIIHYIDFGNEEICSFENMRKSVPLHQIPTQAHKCMLNRIRPVGKQWDRQTLDYIHKSVVEKQCYVKVSGEVVNGVVPIELKYDKLWINDHLVDFEMAEYTDGTKALITKFAPFEKNKKEDIKEDVIIESDSGPDYIVVDDPDTTADQILSSTDDSFDISSLKGTDWNKLIDEEETTIDGNYITYPKNEEEEFTCDITIINDMNTLELSIIFEDDTTIVYEQMFEELQSECINMAPLNGIFENKACVAIFPEDGRWYRASILQFSESKNRVKVKYIDYGNIEVISLTDTREINEEWAKLPPATISAKLYGVRLNPDVDINVIQKEYTRTFLDRGPFHVKVISYSDSIPLVEIKDDKNELVYKKLLEDNMFIKCE